MEKNTYTQPQLYVAQTGGASIICSSADNLNYRDDWGSIFNGEEE